MAAPAARRCSGREPAGSGELCDYPVLTVMSYDYLPRASLDPDRDAAVGEMRMPSESEKDRELDFDELLLTEQERLRQTLDKSCQRLRQAWSQRLRQAQPEAGASQISKASSFPEGPPRLVQAASQWAPPDERPSRQGAVPTRSSVGFHQEEEDDDDICAEESEGGLVDTAKAGDPRPRVSVLEEEKERKRRAQTLALHRHHTSGLDDLPRSDASRLAKIVYHMYFDLFFGVLIIINAFLMGVEADVGAANLGQEQRPLWFFITSLVFTTIFAIELLLRVLVHGWRYFGPNGWNWLDIITVSLSVFEIVVYLATSLSGSTWKSNTDATQFRALRLLRITRLVKVVKAARIVRVIRALRTLVHHILTTIKSLVWVILLLGTHIYLLAIVFTEASTEYRTVTLQQHGLEAINGDVDRYFSTVPRSMLTLFMSITSGVSWEACVLALSDLGGFWVFLFTTYICFAQLAVLNVVTGVFCQTAIDSAQHDQDLMLQTVMAQRENHTEALSRIFREMDIGSQGSVTILEFQETLQTDKVKAYFESLGLATEDMWMLFTLLDTGKGNVLNLDEFIQGCMRLKGNAKGYDMAKLCYDQKMLTEMVIRFIQRTDDSLASMRSKLGQHGGHPQLRMTNGPSAAASVATSGVSVPATTKPRPPPRISGEGVEESSLESSPHETLTAI